MSLVAYAASSDDESDNDNEKEMPTNQELESKGQISDEDSAAVNNPKQLRTMLKLPVPKQEGELDSILPLFGRLPVPKATYETKIESIEEEDDEFLHKKAVPLESPASIVPPLKKNLVRITIPSLKDFDDVQERKVKKTDVAVKPSTFSSLMSILPQPKSEQNFAKSKPASNAVDSKESSKKINLVPDTVKNRRPAQNTENVDKKPTRRPPPIQKPKALPVNMSDSEGSDNEGGDFFSLKSDESLPEVSADEIAAMVSKKAAEMAQISSKFASVAEAPQSEQQADELLDAPIETNSQQLDSAAIQALIGSQAKRRKMDKVEIIDISSDQVLPNKDEWLRTALASATTYQPTGVLTDEEPAAGTRRKHQITYLAHKAKANEAELQAMWSANRQNRRQTQSKYGF